MLRKGAVILCHGEPSVLLREGEEVAAAAAGAAAAAV